MGLNVHTFVCVQVCMCAPVSSTHFECCPLDRYTPSTGHIHALIYQVSSHAKVADLAMQRE